MPDIGQKAHKPQLYAQNYPPQVVYRLWGAAIVGILRAFACGAFARYSTSCVICLSGLTVTVLYVL